MIPLLSQYPGLKEKIPYVSLGEFPTPIEHMAELGTKIGTDHLYVKNEGLSGSLYGGNKIRKLEFLLADAIEKKAKEILTFGFAGSNHALATAVYANKMNLECINMLLEQPNAQYVRNNLQFSFACNAELHHFKNEMPVYLSTLKRLFKGLIKYGKFPYIIMPGGSSPLGTIGYVNAAFELKEQIEKGLLPEPDQVFVPLGSMGTVAGLMIGLKAAGLKIRVIPVRVVDNKYANKEKLMKLCKKTLALVRSCDSSFPEVKIIDDEVDIMHDFFGKQYALFTDQGMAAVHLTAKTQGIKLDGTYTGKAMAAIIEHVKNHDTKNRVVLFWNTYNAHDFSDTIKSINYHHLPDGFHQYFEGDVQPLDSTHNK
jgi:1-aminocyclopropane-1-carboxylate deaminase/D-cysteine desulfhydrase-like pyridoxal-dependent ACC family enzyme